MPLTRIGGLTDGVGCRLMNPMVQNLLEQHGYDHFALTGALCCATRPCDCPGPGQRPGGQSPGTFGTLAAALPCVRVCGWRWGWSPALLAWLLPLLFALGCWACQRTGDALGAPDHGAMVWDEMVAMWALLSCAASHAAGLGAGFAAVWVFDIVKPWPIRWLDAQLKGSFGVMLDDAGGADGLGGVRLAAPALGLG